MPALSRLGDQGIHLGTGEPGTITTVSSVQVITEDGKPTALEGDLYTCTVDHHNDNPNLLIPYPTQQDTRYFDNKRLITVGATTTCGATIIQGYSEAITEPPGPPLALGPISLTTTVDVPLIIPASTLIAKGLDLDLLPMILVSVQSPVNGVVNLVGTIVTFTPDSLYVGPASFTYTLSSINGSAAPITANITVTP